MWRVSNLEEVDLNGAVGEVQDDGTLCSEPEGEVRQPRQLVSFPPCYVGAGLQQVLAHVVAEVFQQRYLQRERANKCEKYYKWEVITCTSPKNLNQRLKTMFAEVSVSCQPSC